MLIEGLPRLSLRDLNIKDIQFIDNNEDCKYAFDHMNKFKKIGFDLEQGSWGRNNF